MRSFAGVPVCETRLLFGAHGGHEAERVHDLVQHRVLHVARIAALGRERVRPARDRPVEEPVEIHRRDAAGEVGRERAAAARERAGAVVVDGVELVRVDEARGLDLGLDRVADEGTGLRDLLVRPAHPEERDVELAAGRVQPQRPPTGLVGEPALERVDRVDERAVEIELAILAVAREHVHDVHLLAGDLVGAVRELVVCGRRRRRVDDAAGVERASALMEEGIAHAVRVAWDEVRASGERDKATIRRDPRQLAPATGDAARSDHAFRCLRHAVPDQDVTDIPALPLGREARAECDESPSGAQGRPEALLELVSAAVDADALVRVCDSVVDEDVIAALVAADPVRVAGDDVGAVGAVADEPAVTADRRVEAVRAGAVLLAADQGDFVGVEVAQVDIEPALERAVFRHERGIGLERDVAAVLAHLGDVGAVADARAARIVDARQLEVFRVQVVDVHPHEERTGGRTGDQVARVGGENRVAPVVGQEAVAAPVAVRPGGEVAGRPGEAIADHHVLTDELPSRAAVGVRLEEDVAPVVADPERDVAAEAVERHLVAVNADQLHLARNAIFEERVHTTAGGVGSDVRPEVRRLG